MVRHYSIFQTGKMKLASDKKAATLRQSKKNRHEQTDRKRRKKNEAEKRLCLTVNLMATKYNESWLDKSKQQWEN